MGAFVVMLFILGLFIVKGPMKWALLAATIISILLSWGKNFMGFTDFFIDHFPMYSKFRTVASILVIAEFTIPMLAMLALKKIIDYGVKHMIYVSCKPTSLARDLEILAEGGYYVQRAVAVDQFPWTNHVETIALLTKANAV